MTDRYRRFRDMDSETDMESQPRYLGAMADPFAIEVVTESGEPETDGDLGTRAGPTHGDDDSSGGDGGIGNGDTKADAGDDEDVTTTDIRDYKVVDDFTLNEPTTGIRGFRFKLRKVLEHLAFRAITVFLVVLDLCLVIADLALNDMNKPLEVASLIILTYFLIEGALRIFAQGPREFVRHWIEVVDAVVIVVSFIFAILPLALSHLSTNVAFIRLVVVGRLIRIILIIRLVSEKKNLEKATRQVVSQNKRRYQRDGFDLDLCYITDRVIAMSFPSTGLMAFYRNPIKEVARFLDTKHKDHYRVFNLCSERMYDESLFQNRVNRYRIDDHNVPTLSEMLHFAQTVRAWLSEHCRNVIAVHCKGGKGRTGTMICTWLVESGAFEEAKESLEYFGDRRTDLSVGTTFQGVETPSQGRYVGYFGQVKRLYFGSLPPERSLRILSFTIKSITGVGSGDGEDLTCTIITGRRIWTYNLKKRDNCKVSMNVASDNLVIELTNKPLVSQDVKVMFFSSNKKAPKGYDNCLFYFWFYTSFIEDNRLCLSRSELDNPHKKKTWTVFRKDFGINLEFGSHTPQSVT